MDGQEIVENEYCRMVNEAVQKSFDEKYDFNDSGNAARMIGCAQQVYRGFDQLNQNAVTKQIKTEERTQPQHVTNRRTVSFIDSWPTSAATGIPYAETVLNWFRANEDHRASHENKLSQTYAWNLNYTRICVMRFLLHISEVQLDNQLLTVTMFVMVGRMLTALTSLCRFVKWSLDTEYMKNIGWRYKSSDTLWSDDYVRTRDLLASDLDARNVPPKLLFFNNRGNMRMGRELRKMEARRWTIYKGIISEMVNQVFVPVHISNTFAVAVEADRSLQRILGRLESLKTGPQYIIKRERPFIKNCFRDIWPSTGVPHRGHNDKFYFVNRVEYNLLKSKGKLTASHKTLPIGGMVLAPCYSSAYVWNVEFLVVCLMRLLYHHVSQPAFTDAPQTDQYAQQLGDILKLSLHYWQCVRAVYLVQMDTTHKPLVADGSSYDGLDYREHAVVRPSRQNAGYPIVP